MSHKFQGVLYPTASDMCDAIVCEWMSAGGLHKPPTMREFFAGKTDEALVAEMIEDWSLNEREDPTGESWLEARDADEAMLIDSMHELRVSVTEPELWLVEEGDVCSTGGDEDLADRDAVLAWAPTEWDALKLAQAYDRGEIELSNKTRGDRVLAALVWEGDKS